MTISHAGYVSTWFSRTPSANTLFVVTRYSESATGRDRKSEIFVHSVSMVLNNPLQALRAQGVGRIDMYFRDTNENAQRLPSIHRARVCDGSA